MSLDLSVLGIDRGSLEAGIGTLLASELAPLLGAAAEDLKDFGLAIARSGVSAMLAGDKDWTRELKGQVKALVEVQRIRVEVVDWDLTEKLALMGLKVAFGALGLVKP